MRSLSVMFLALRMSLTIRTPRLGSKGGSQALMALPWWLMVRGIASVSEACSPLSSLETFYECGHTVGTDSLRESISVCSSTSTHGTSRVKIR